jgi:rubrerythrin
MDLAQAIQTAIRYETSIRNLYRTAAEKSTDPVGRKVFGLLADEEDEHLRFLEERLKEWTDSGEVQTAPLRSHLPAREAIEESGQKVRSNLTDIDVEGELALLSRALEVEKETSDFYRKMVSELDARGQALFEPFVESEDNHLGLVQAEMDQIKGLGYWFDIQEFDLQSG